MKAVVVKKVTVEYVYEFDAEDVSWVRGLNGNKVADVKVALMEWASDMGEINASEQRTLGERWSVKLIREPVLLATLPSDQCE